MTKSALKKKEEALSGNLATQALARVRLEALERQFGKLPAPKYEGVWPPDYVKAQAWREMQSARLTLNPDLAKQAVKYYSTRCNEFVNHWCITYDPRNSGKADDGKLAYMPFITFPRQTDFLQFLEDCMAAEAGGLIEKSRDMGATWLCSAFSVWLWLFKEGVSVGWGSRTVDLVDKIGNPDSIFEKMRMIIKNLPPFLTPVGFDPELHLSWMRLINPSNGSTITGEGGDNIGRGGRKLIYFLDEAGHVERPEKIEAALGDTTRVRIDISSVPGVGHVFERKRHAGQDWMRGQPMAKDRTNVFVMDWSDHPEKTREWYEARRKKHEDEGTLHIFAREVDRDYAASVDTVLIPGEWIGAALEIRQYIDLAQFTDIENAFAGLDIADEGGDKNSLAIRKGPLLCELHQWGERNTGATTRRAVSACKPYKRVQLQYDVVGVGSGVKAEAERLYSEGLLGTSIFMIPWNSGFPVQNPLGRILEDDPDSPRNRDYYGNLKAQGYWSLRRRFERTWRAFRQFRNPEDEPDFTYDVNELIILDPKHPLAPSLRKELAQPKVIKDSRMRIWIDKLADGQRSPNLADAVMMSYFPIENRRFYARGAFVAPKIMRG